MESAMAAPGLSGEYAEESGIIRDATLRIRKARTRGELGTILVHEVHRYSLFDLQIIGGHLYKDVEKLPSPYREAIRPYFNEQLFGKHHELLVLHYQGAFGRMNTPLADPEMFRKFCDMLQEGCFAVNDTGERNPCFRNPKNRLFYYLISAFSMFVLDQPGHPVGMPFPGGFKVEQRGRDYYCLIRDKEKEVFFSICNFCPAKQSEES
jgi:uncharacterized protein (UPF0305 family)